MPLRESLHVHTWRCGHAEGAVADYAAAARAAGMAVLGIADHTPLPDGRWPEIRMPVSALATHAAEVRAADGGGLRVLLGMECEPLPEYFGFYDEVLRGQAGCDYLIAACHFVADGRGGWDWPGERPVSARRYTEQAVAAIASGRFCALAHPDLLGYTPGPWTVEHTAMARDICAAAAAHGVALELNGYGLRKPRVADGAGGERPIYPWDPFWTIAAEAGAPAVVWSDAHRPADVAHGDELIPWARERGLRLVGAGDLVPALAG